jgi:hypothetical protein
MMKGMMDWMLRLWVAGALALGAFGCDSSGPRTDPPDSAAVDTGTPDLAAEDGVDDAASVPDLLPTTPPVFETFSVLDSDLIQLVAWLDIATDLPTQLSVELEDLATGDRTAVPYAAPPKTSHAPVVMGLRAESSYRVHATATNAAGLETVEAADFSTGPLPGFLSDLTVETADPARMQPGYTLLSIDRVGQGETTVVVDAAGEVVFYHSFAGGFVVPFPGGTYLQTGSGVASSLFLSNLLGRISPELLAADYGSPIFHHLPGVTPEGTFLALGLEVRTLGGYEEGGVATTYNVVGDVVYELSPEGALLQEVALLDVLDPLRPGESFHTAFWDMAFPGLPGGTKDWSHANSIAMDPDDGGLVISVSGQNWVVKLDRDTGALRWRLGPEGDFSLAAGGRWSAFVHAAQPLAGGRLLLYDNDPAAPPYASRAVEYALDTTTWTATQTWEHAVDPPVQSLRLGEAHRLGNGNVLIADASINDNDAGDPHDASDQVWSRVVEVTDQAPPEEVFRLILRKQDDAPGGYRLLTARRIPSLY